MVNGDHKYLIEKLHQQEIQLRNYEECFGLMMEWFVKNRRHLKKLPVSRRIKIPGEK